MNALGRWMVLGVAAASVSAGGCELLAGVHEVHLLEGTSSAGGGDTTGTTTGGSGGTAGTGGGGTGGSRAFACAPSGDEFEVLGQADIPGAELTTGEIFIISEPNALPPRAHVVAALDPQTKTLVARTVKGVNKLGSTVTWEPPPGTSRYVGGYAEGGQVTVVAHLSGPDGPTPAEIGYTKDADGQIPFNAQAQLKYLQRPMDCDDPAATIQQLRAVRKSGQTFTVSTWDDCTAEKRRLYRSGSSGFELLRETDKTGPSATLVDFEKVGNYDFLVFSDGASSGYSSGASAADLSSYSDVVLGDAGSTVTTALGLAAASPNALAVFWGVFTKNTVVPSSLFGGVMSSDQAKMADSKDLYDEIHEYTEYAEATRWGKPSVGPTMLISGGSDLDGSAVRFSVLSPAVKPLSMNNEVKKSAAGGVGDVVAGHFGPNAALIIWTAIDGGVYTVRARVYDCN